MLKMLVYETERDLNTRQNRIQRTDWAPVQVNEGKCNLATLLQHPHCDAASNLVLANGVGEYKQLWHM